MKKDVTLVILAGGMGSRFGGLKQIEPMGPNGEFIIDYSIYDAIRAGFNKVVFLIRKENFEIFKETIGSRVEPLIKVEYSFQEMNTITTTIDIPNERVKPLGTAHAILCAKDLVNEPFAIINADDFYGKDAFIEAYNFLSTAELDSSNYGMIGYKVINTLTENGSVKRGVCEVDNNNNLIQICESKIEVVDGIIIASPLNGSNSFIVDNNATVSMNFLLFTPSIFRHLEEKFPLFLEKNKNNLIESEFLIPDVVTELIKDKISKVKVIKTNAVWQGVTYKEDTPKVKKAISDLIKNGEYNYNLWD